MAAKMGTTSTLFLIISSTLCLSVYALDWLIYASVHDKHNKNNGLYYGALDIVNGTTGDLSVGGVSCANMLSAGFYTGYMINSMGYDPSTRMAVVQMRTNSLERASVFTTKACQRGPPKCKDANINVVFAQGDTKRHNSNVGPFAMWNHSIYFIAHLYEKGPKRTILHRIELRRMDGCESRQPFTTQNAFDIEACSSFITLIAEETGEDLGFQMEDKLLVAKQLFIAQQHDQLVYLIQIQNQTFDDNYDVEKFSMLLYAAWETSPTKILYEEALPDAFAEHEIANLGGIDYREGKLCWSMLDRVFCGHWDGHGKVRRIRRVVESGGAAQVCTVKGQKYRNIPYSNITTGVAIAKIENGDITLIFGCYSGEGGQGGAGVVTLTSSGKTMDLLPLTDGKGKIYAGAMVVGCKEEASSSHVIATDKLLLLTIIMLSLIFQYKC